MTNNKVRWADYVPPMLRMDGAPERLRLDGFVKLTVAGGDEGGDPEEGAFGLGVGEVGDGLAGGFGVGVGGVHCIGQ